MEFRVLQEATQVHWWRWRAEEKRLRRRGVRDPWDLHLVEMRALHRLWMKMRAEAGLGRRVPASVVRARDQVSLRKWRKFLSEIG